MSNLAIQQVMKIRGYNVETDQMELKLTALKSSTFSNGKEMTYVTKDNVKVASFDFGATASIEGASAYIQDDLLAAQLGVSTETLTTTSEIRTTEVVAITSDSGSGDKTASGSANSEVKFAYILDSDYNHTGTVLTQAATASATEFAYDSGTNTYTTSGLADGTKIEVAFYPITSTARKIENVTTNFTKTLRIEADLILKDTCTDVLQYGKLVFFKGKVAGEFSWDLQEGGNASVHDFSVEALSTCSDDLWAIYFYDKTNMA